MKLKKFLKKYSHAWVLLYGFIYMPWFLYLERHVTTHYYRIHSPLDDYIPFVEYFIIPYLLWFAFIAITALYFFFTDKQGFYKLATFLITGMTIFLIICTIFPNGLNLRPDTFARDNIFVDMVKQLYAADTPTNVLPSIHVFNSLGVSFAIAHSERLKKKPYIQYAAYILAGLIILSTVFLKQHSVTDVIAAMVMAGAVYPFVYVPANRKATSLSHQPVI
ncbi:phosphatase PAP2 family protein [Sporofaciens sp. SGI.106]|uniref:phosphatase PAP2 family protein n=1 Tax=Sporofaciens sp. SGI.106 TaxID=3420568 RepID=UPI002A948239|nr:phosphatase PAP2 family protein [Lachnoclostridium sp.]